MDMPRLRIGKLSPFYVNPTVADDIIQDDPYFLDQLHFHHMLRLERMRTERSKKPFLLLLLDISRLMEKARDEKIVEKIRHSLSPMLREVDIKGWYHYDQTIGVLFTEIAQMDQSFIDAVIHKIYDRLREKLSSDWMDYIYISYHVFPEMNQGLSADIPFNINLYPDLDKKDFHTRFSLLIKTIFDSIGSALALMLFSPLFLIIAIAVKATSPGPVFFRQERVGLNGKKFVFFKFRSMTVDNDPARHKEYITRFINRQESSATGPGIFKLTNDDRVTPIGHFLRKTSLDELPQFINVLKGDMSLVGPRPPIPYECDLYDIWHRRRLLAAKPGITGMWQVNGRSRTTFDEMVRMDLKYLHEWSLLLDFKILLMTPKAVFSGSGAF